MLCGCHEPLHVHHCSLAVIPNVCQLEPEALEFGDPGQCRVQVRFKSCSVIIKPRYDLDGTRLCPLCLKRIAETLNEFFLRARLMVFKVAGYHAEKVDGARNFR